MYVGAERGDTLTHILYPTVPYPTLPYRTNSIAAKRCLLPSKQGDDGWTSIYFDGVQIGTLKGRCLEVEREKGSASAETSSGSSSAGGALDEEGSGSGVSASSSSGSGGGDGGI